MTTTQADSTAKAIESTAAAERRVVAQTLRTEAAAIEQLAGSLGPEIVAAIDLVDRCRGHVVVTGLGKSGLIAQKISATLSSIGIPSHFMHPTEALHGDLGRIRDGDVLWALSLSGNTDEVVQLGLVVRENSVPIISVTSNPESRLGKLATVHLSIGATMEACPHNLAPTTSTTVMLALGDAIGIAVSRRRQFSEADFRKRHPGGALGALLQPITDILRFEVGKNLPLIALGTKLGDALRQAEVGRRPGAMLVVDEQGRLAGLFTDGDLRRLWLERPDALHGPIDDVMTPEPRRLRSDAIVRDAVRLAQEFRPDEIPVVDEQGRPIGLVDVQDLVAMRVVSES